MTQFNLEDFLSYFYQKCLSLLIPPTCHVSPKEKKKIIQEKWIFFRNEINMIYIMKYIKNTQRAKPHLIKHIYISTRQFIYYYLLLTGLYFLYFVYHMCGSSNVPKYPARPQELTMSDLFFSSDQFPI